MLLAYHLIEADQRQLLDYAYLQAKLNALLANCDLLKKDRPIRWVRQTVLLSANALQIDKRLLAGHLLERTRSIAEDNDICTLRQRKIKLRSSPGHANRASIPICCFPRMSNPGLALIELTVKATHSLSMSHTLARFVSDNPITTLVVSGDVIVAGDQAGRVLFLHFDESKITSNELHSELTRGYLLPLIG